MTDKKRRKSANRNVSSRQFYGGYYGLYGLGYGYGYGAGTAQNPNPDPAPVAATDPGAGTPMTGAADAGGAV